MRQITGTDILYKIRKKGSRIPIWLMTADDDYTMERALSEGFSGLVRKPINMSRLTDILSKGRKIQFPQLSTLFQGDEEAIKDILAGFVDSTDREMDTLESYIEQGEFAKAQQLAHRIYPFFNQLDAGHLCVALHKMDRLRGEDKVAYPSWKEELSKTIEEIRKFSADIRRDYLS